MSLLIWITIAGFLTERIPFGEYIVEDEKNIENLPEETELKVVKNIYSMSINENSSNKSNLPIVIGIRIFRLLCCVE
ncbi:MAG TPA: hypothetical protein ENI49_05320 [Thermoplasmatales archaeon]|nr:hypothetical protein [Thermoplasmatales archaeon]